MLKIFWNREERRLRAGWRILVVGLVYFALLSLLPWLATLISDTLSDATGLTAKIAGYVIATGNFPLAVTAPDYLTRVNNFARMIAGRPLLLSGMAVCGLISLWLAARFIDRLKLADYGFHLSRRWWLDFGFGCLLGALLMAFIFFVELAAGWVTIQHTFYSPLLPFWAIMVIGLLSYIGVGNQRRNPRTRLRAAQPGGGIAFAQSLPADGFSRQLYPHIDPVRRISLNECQRHLGKHLFHHAHRPVIRPGLHPHR